MSIIRKRLIYFVVIIVITTFSLLVTGIINSKPHAILTWGVCGHQLYGGEIWGTPDTQFATLEKYGLKTYRFDIPLVDDKPNAVADLQELINIANNHHITLHPILYVPFTWNDNATDSGRYPDTEAGLEAQGYNRAYPFVLNFASQINDWELENEISLKKGVKSGQGILASDYETPKARQWAAVLRGMSKAIHDVRERTGKPLRTVVDTTYVDFGLIQFLENNGVLIDKLAYHYYYEVDTSPYKIYAPNGTTVDIFSEFKKLDKPVIINEFNAAEIYDPKNRNKPYNDQKALASLKNHIEYISQQTEAPIEGVEYYELYDEPGKDVAESNFGLMKDAIQAKMQILLAAVYAGGELSPEEKTMLVSAGLFTEGSLREKLEHARNLRK